MGDSSVSIRLHGEVVEDAVLRVGGTVRIGEADAAQVAFPGADLVVVRAGERLLVRGRALEEGDSLELSLGAVDVTVEHTLRGRTPPEWHSSFDARFLAVVLLVTAIGTWLDAADNWWDHDPLSLAPSGHATTQAVAQDEASVQRSTLPSHTDMPALAADADEDQAQGPRHLPDDLLSGTGWNAWYRRAVPVDDQYLDAYDRLRTNPMDAGAHRIVAQAAYDNDDFDVAAWHYRWLANQYPDDRGILLRLARAERRRGRHNVEIDLYRHVLAQDAQNTEAMGGLAVALARVGRLDEAYQLEDELQATAPMAPSTDLTIALVAALQGHDCEALDALDRAIGAARAALPGDADRIASRPGHRPGFFRPAQGQATAGPAAPPPGRRGTDSRSMTDARGAPGPQPATLPPSLPVRGDNRARACAQADLGGLCRVLRSLDLRSPARGAPRLSFL